MVSPKTVMDFIKDDPTLLEKKTYEEITKLPEDNDYTIEEAYRGYCSVLEKFNN